jgi:hypothetical protein
MKDAQALPLLRELRSLIDRLAPSPAVDRQRVRVELRDGLIVRTVPVARDARTIERGWPEEGEDGAREGEC